MLDKNISFIANYLWQESVRNIDNILSESDKTKFNITDYYYLTSIRYMDNPNFGDVSDQLGLTKPAISAMVKRLENIGFLFKKQSIQDKRVFFLELTEKGKQIVDGDNHLYVDLTNIISSLVSKNQLEQVDCLLGEVVDILKNKKHLGEKT